MGDIYQVGFKEVVEEVEKLTLEQLWDKIDIHRGRDGLPATTDIETLKKELIKAYIEEYRI
jgi:hypothetical protein